MDPFLAGFLTSAAVSLLLDIGFFFIKHASRKRFERELKRRTSHLIYP